MGNEFKNFVYEAIRLVTGVRAGSAGSGGTNFLQSLLATTYYTPTNNTTITGQTAKMLGYGSTIAFTPRRTGRILIIISGNLNATGTAGNFGYGDLYYGTGAAPANNAAQTGTLLGHTTSAKIAQGTFGTSTIAASSLVTGLTLNTAIWVDFAAYSDEVAGTSLPQDLNVVIMEI